MPSSLPTTDSNSKAVNTFGLGTYDNQPDSDGEHGENSNLELPEFPFDPFGPDRLLSYPQTTAASFVPYDYERPPQSKNPPPSHLDSVVHSVSEAKIPVGEPSAHSDYYDRTVVGEAIEDMFSGRGDDAYASSEEDSLPSIPSNYQIHDNGTQGLGNYWSGMTVEDQAVPAGFPSTEFEDPQRFQQTTFASMKKIATNIELVRSLTSNFLKTFGKKNLTKRHVLSFLQSDGNPQYLSSDIIRCLNEDHGLYVKDVLDEFPVKKSASTKVNSLSSIRNKLIELEINNIRDPSSSNSLRRAAADLSRTIVLLNKLGVKNV